MTSCPEVQLSMLPGVPQSVTKKDVFLASPKVDMKVTLMPLYSRFLSVAL